MKRVQYRRKREGKTDYKKRLALLKSGLPRLVVRRSNKGIQAQIVEYEENGDKVIATVHASELAKHGWKGATGNIPSAYLTGILLANKAKMTNDVIVDIGLQKHHPGGRLYAVAKGAIDAGLKVRIGEDVLPPEERLQGGHINEQMAAAVADMKIKLLK